MKDIVIENKEELKTLQDFENNQFVELRQDELNASLKEAVANIVKKFSKKKSISIRLFEYDIDRIKAIAPNKGVTYQTYISHIFHKVTTGRIHPKNHS